MTIHASILTRNHIQSKPISHHEVNLHIKVVTCLLVLSCCFIILKHVGLVPKDVLLSRLKYLFTD